LYNKNVILVNHLNNYKMGRIIYDDHEKSYRAVCIQNMQRGFDPKIASTLEEKTLPALEHFQELLEGASNKDGKPIKVTITVEGKESRSFSIEIENLSEIQEILQWTICK
jgi:ribosomal protein L11